MKELIQLFQIWKDQGAIKPDGLLKDADIQMLIDKMAIESQESDSLPCVRLLLPSEKEISMMANDYSTQEGKYRVASYEAFRDGANRIAKILQSNEA